ncbi:HD domain-containing protein [Thermogladius sp.]|uniref:HD domain-containing protein n=1 Tax=Thermogladius sp. TaxID=2023064 RepID=UPI003D11FFC6
MSSRDELDRLLALYNIPRAGWLIRGVPAAFAEDVASHSYLVAVLALRIAREARGCGGNVDEGKALTMALIHDLPEALTGDIPRPVKERLGDVVGRLEEEALGKLGFAHFKDLYAEVESATSVEALLVKIADDLATYLRAVYYLNSGFEGVRDIAENTRSNVMSLIQRLPGGLRECVQRYVSTLLEYKAR